ncbi:MAG TPA: metallophosphoesterase [Pseudobacteroides sp.]|uniref:metallophosphoesterase n=1 Tax=Pseudobacteroides sp. TaxID=1968840 RepID=UPI002F955EE0
MIFLSIIAILLVLGMYTGINYYIGAKGLQLLNSVLPSISPKIYWPIFFLIAFSFIIERFISKFMPEIVSYLFSLVGSYWIAAMVYFGIIILIIKLIFALDRWLSFIPSHLKTSHMSNIVIASTSALVALILIIGTWQARNPITVKYDISINKDGGSIKNLHAVMVSDIHLGTLVRKGQLDKMVGLINDKNPDIVFIAGDLINDDIKPFLDQNMPESLRQVKSKYGVYYCLGNHEYYGSSSNEIARVLTEAGIKVLRDSYVNIQDSIYIIGREDMGSGRHLNQPRATLSQIISGLDKSKPLILLDHQPSNLKEPAGEAIDLQLSGHTHRGQFFPFNFITNAIFEKDWGYLKKGDFQLIVSSGLGTWGPPIRFLNSTELVEINISFNTK